MTTKIIMREEQFGFRAPHTIDAFPGDQRVHDHVFQFAVEVLVDVDDDRGYAFDHALIVGAGNAVASELHGKQINDIPGLEVGTTEVLLAKYIVPRLRDRIEQHGGAVVLVELRQSPDRDLYDNSRHVTDHIKIWRREDQE